MSENRVSINLNDAEIFKTLFFRLIETSSETKAIISQSAAVLDRLERDVADLIQTTVRKTTFDTLEKRVVHLEESTKKTDRMKLLLVGLIAGLVGNVSEVIKLFGI